MSLKLRSFPKIGSREDLVNEIGQYAELARQMEEVEEQIVAENKKKRGMTAEWKTAYAAGSADTYRRMATHAMEILDGSASYLLREKS